jgi:hypothetical protein
MWQWYKIYNLDNFDKLGVTDYTFDIELEGRGWTTFRICKGTLYGVVVDGIYLAPSLNGKNEFNKGNRSAYIDDKRNLWVGYNATEN